MKFKVISEKHVSFDKNLILENNLRGPYFMSEILSSLSLVVKIKQYQIKLLYSITFNAINL